MQLEATTITQLVVNFWQVHGIFFIFFMFFFPRLTMLFTQICFATFAGPLFWVGWLLLPRITVAILATMFYFTTNPILCVFTWIWAIAGEAGEKTELAEA
jgi:hypothetical protein